MECGSEPCSGRNADVAQLINERMEKKSLTFPQHFEIIRTNEVTPIVRMKQERDKLHDC